MQNKLVHSDTPFLEREWEACVPDESSHLGPVAIFGPRSRNTAYPPSVDLACSFSSSVAIAEWLSDEDSSGEWDAILSSDLDEFGAASGVLIKFIKSPLATRPVEDLAREVLRGDAAYRWMRLPNADLAGQRPLDLIAAGQHQRVEDLLLALAEGVTS